jgi:hypothetical protein
MAVFAVFHKSFILLLNNLLTMRARLIASALVTMLLSSASVILFSLAPIHAQEANCDPSYPGVCIPPYPPDLNCGDISDKRFEVLPPDPHGFDGEGDGIGCES